jgi:hypothetical protein
LNALELFAYDVWPNHAWDLKTFLDNPQSRNCICHLGGGGRAGEVSAPGSHGTSQGWARATSNKQIYLNVWGNILFGYTGVEAGFGGSVLQSITDGVGWAGGLIGLGSFGNFNNPGNHLERQMGIDMAASNGRNATGGAVANVIIREIGELSSKYCDVLPYPFYPNNSADKSKWRACQSTSGPSEW